MSIELDMTPAPNSQLHAPGGGAYGLERSPVDYTAPLPDRVPHTTQIPAETVPNLEPKSHGSTTEQDFNAGQQTTQPGISAQEAGRWEFTKQNIYSLATSGNRADTESFARILQRLTPAQRADYERFRYLKDQEGYIAKARADADAAHQEAQPSQHAPAPALTENTPAVVETKPPTEASDTRMLGLYGQKLRDPEAFSQIYDKLDPADRRKFDIFEVQEYMRMKAANPNADLNAWGIPEPKPVWVRDPLHTGDDQPVRLQGANSRNSGNVWSKKGLKQPSKIGSAFQSAGTALKNVFSRQPKGGYSTTYRPLPPKRR